MATRLLPILLASSLAAAPLAAIPHGEPAPDLIDVATSAGSFTTLAAALDAAGLVDALRAEGPFTVFAPTDAAFAALPAGTVESLLRPESRDQLIDILTLHVVPGRVPAADAVIAGTAESLSGAPLTFALEKGGLRVNGTSVIDTDIDARNGVIHVIDSVLLPPGSPAPTGATALDLIGLAINRGAPLFNNGQHAACAAVYEVAAISLRDLGAPALPAAASRLLAADLARLERIRDPADRSWALRGTLDAVTELITSREATTAAAAPDAPNTRLLMDFEDVATTAAWFPVNDNVMGGISQGGYRQTDRGTALFAGALSLENNGGFSTIRSPAGDLDLSDWDGLVMRVRGDGRTYWLSCMSNDRRNEINTFQQEFETVAGEWIEVRVPFENLSHRVMGWTVPGSNIAPADIRSLSVGLADKNTAPFALEIDWISAYREG